MVPKRTAYLWKLKSGLAEYTALGRSFAPYCCPCDVRLCHFGKQKSLTIVVFTRNLVDVAGLVSVPKLPTWTPSSRPDNAISITGGRNFGTAISSQPSHMFVIINLNFTPNIGSLFSVSVHSLWWHTGLQLPVRVFYTTIGITCFPRTANSRWWASLGRLRSKHHVWHNITTLFILHFIISYCSYYLWWLMIWNNPTSTI